MIADIRDAYNKMNSRFTSVWNAAWPGSPTLGPDGQVTAPRVIYDDDKNPEPSDGAPYVRITVRHLDGFQAAFGQNSRRHRNLGQFTVAIYAPLGLGLTTAHPYVKVTQSAFRGATIDGLQFRAVRVREQGGRGAYYQINVIADFEYDEIV